MKRFIGLAAICLFTFLPTIGRFEVLARPQLWIYAALSIAAVLLQPPYSPFDETRSPEDKGSLRQIQWTAYLVQMGGLIEAVHIRRSAFEWTWLTSAALLAMLTGITLRTWAVRTLGKFFTLEIQVSDGHRVIRHGPYRILRHPSYAGGVLLICFAPLFLHAYATFIIGAVLFPIAVIRRIRLEEEMLRSELGEDYRKYEADSYRLIPFVW